MLRFNSMLVNPNRGNYFMTNGRIEPKFEMWTLFAFLNNVVSWLSVAFTQILCLNALNTLMKKQQNHAIFPKEPPLDE